MKYAVFKIIQIYLCKKCIEAVQLINPVEVGLQHRGLFHVKTVILGVNIDNQLNKFIYVIYSR